MERIKREIDEGINFNYRPELSFFSHNVVILHVYVVVLLCQIRITKNPKYTRQAFKKRAKLSYGPKRTKGLQHC